MMGLSFLAAASLATLSVLLPVQVAADLPYHTDHDSYQKGDLGDRPMQKFRSTSIVAPIYQINYFDAEKVDTDTPYMFLTGKYGKWGPSMVSSKDLSLVWADQKFGGLAQTTRTWENWRGQRVMTVYASGAVRVYNEAYEELYAFGPQGDLKGVYPDSHEAMLSHDGTVVLIACPGKEVNLTSVGGPATGKRVGNCHVQEFDPETKEVLFQFATLDFFDVDDSYFQYHGEDNWDFCHMNAAEKMPDGNFLISYRHLSTVLLVDGKTREVIWAMSGKKNMFTDITPGGKNAEFHFQHEARVSGPNRFTVFDNHRLKNGFCTEGQCSRGLEVEYDTEKKTVKMINEWYHPQKLDSSSRGGVQRTPTGNVIVAWGQNPMYTEYTKDGELVMDIQRGQVLGVSHGIFDIITYRVWKGNWVGRPTQPPDIAAVNGSVYVSWNGATEVNHYALLLSDSKDDLDGPDKVVAQSPRNGFETEIKIPKAGSFARVAAIDKDGNILGSTKPVDTASGELQDVDYDVKSVTSGSSRVITGVPSAAAIKVPLGTMIPPGSRFNSHSWLSWTLIGSIVGAVVICALVVGGVVYFMRRRRARRNASTGKKESDAAYGLLMNEALDENEAFDLRDSEEFEDDKDEGDEHKALRK